MHAILKCPIDEQTLFKGGGASVCVETMTIC